MGAVLKELQPGFLGIVAAGLCGGLVPVAVRREHANFERPSSGVLLCPETPLQPAPAQHSGTTPAISFLIFWDAPCFIVFRERPPTRFSIRSTIQVAQRSLRSLLLPKGATPLLPPNGVSGVMRPTSSFFYRFCTLGTICLESV